MVESAQSSKAQLQKLGDKVASYFVPMVVLVAALVCVAWYVSSPQPNSIKLETAIVNAIAVLVVACPCAMGLATPIAIVAGTNAAARRGILISHGQALEASGEIDIVAFDKTGTLTVGKPQVRRALKDVNLAEEAGSIAHALAQKSKHPLSLAIAAYESQSEPDTLESIHETAGQGLEGRRINGSETVQMGALEWLEANGVSALDDGQGFLKKIETIKQSGWQLVGLATGQRLIAVYVLEDSLKEEADNLVKTFAKLEIECLMLSGDREEAVLHANRKLGFAAKNVYANCLPSDKARVIQTFQEKGLKVAFVGDGINDAPSLAQADLGIAVAAASDIAKATADIHLINSDIQTIPKAITLARQTLRTIKQNLFWAFFYNVAAIPLAALGFLNPMVCAATMGLSDLVVVINSIRLAKR